MKKIIFLVVFLFVCLRQTLALDPNVRKINQNLFDIIVSVIPTQTPTNTPTPTLQPTETPSPTETPQPTKPIATSNPSPQNIESVTPQSSPSLSLETPTPTIALSQNLTPKNVAIYFVIGFLVVVLFLQNWPKVKKWLHEKTS
ncbi:MAG: hypothetical protein QHH09_01175 [Microgenomates group bacterium]|nr:hypothetical protein [Microgenomates group bacterium]